MAHSHIINNYRLEISLWLCTKAHILLALKGFYNQVIYITGHPAFWRGQREKGPLWSPTLSSHSTSHRTRSDSSTSWIGQSPVPDWRTGTDGEPQADELLLFFITSPAKSLCCKSGIHSQHQHNIITSCYTLQLNRHKSSPSPAPIPPICNSQTKPCGTLLNIAEIL